MPATGGSSQGTIWLMYASMLSVNLAYQWCSNVFRQQSVLSLENGSPLTLRSLCSTSFAVCIIIPRVLLPSHNLHGIITPSPCFTFHPVALSFSSSLFPLLFIYPFCCTLPTLSLTLTHTNTHTFTVSCLHFLISNQTLAGLSTADQGMHWSVPLVK